MKKSIPYLLIICSLIIELSMPAQEARLTYELQPGEKYRLEVDIQQTTRSEAIHSPEINLYSLTNLEFTVVSLDEQKNIHLEVAYRDLLLSMLAPGLDIDINSGTGKDTLLTDMVDLLSKGSMQIVMDNTGKMISMSGMENVFSSLEAYPAADSSEHMVILRTLEEVYGSDAFNSLFNLFIFIYPVMQPMTSWTNDITYFFNTKPVTIVNRYNLSRVTAEELTIQGLGMLNAMKEFHEETSMGEVKSVVSGSQTYDFQMHPGSGWLKRCVSRQRVLIETTIVRSSYLPSGLKIPSYTETVFEVNGRLIE